jgi:hypothetical protein
LQGEESRAQSSSSHQHAGEVETDTANQQPLLQSGATSALIETQDNVNDLNLGVGVDGTASAELLPDADRSPDLSPNRLMIQVPPDELLTLVAVSQRHSDNTILDGSGLQDLPLETHGTNTPIHLVSAVLLFVW